VSTLDKGTVIEPIERTGEPLAIDTPVTSPEVYVVAVTEEPLDDVFDIAKLYVPAATTVPLLFVPSHV
jgi:hypothetical protein